MEPQGKGMLKVVSILFIVFGAIGVVALLISLFGLMAMGSVVQQLSEQAGEAADAVNQAVGAAVAGFSGLIIIGAIIGIVGCALELILGIVGLKKCADPSQAGFFVVSGIILCVLQLVGMIMSFSVFSLIGFVLPILFIVGGFMNKKAVAPAA